MKTFKNLLLAVFVVIFSITTIAQTPKEYFQTLCTRVQTQGEAPPQVRMNFYIDKLVSFFYANGWKDDQIISIKEIKVMPPSDPSDWYYFVSVKTKKCTTPFYISYDIGDSNLGELFVIEPNGYPVEFKNFIEAEKKKLRVSDMRTDQLNELVNRVSPKMISRVNVFIKDTIKPYLDDEINKSIDTLIQNYPESDRNIKKQELLGALKQINSYVGINNLLSNYVQNEMDHFVLNKELRETYKTENEAVNEVLSKHLRRIETKAGESIFEVESELKNWIKEQSFQSQLIESKKDWLKKYGNFYNEFITSKQEFDSLSNFIKNETDNKYCFNSKIKISDDYQNTNCKYPISQENLNLFFAFNLLYTDYINTSVQNEKNFYKDCENKVYYSQLWTDFLYHDKNSFINYINSIQNPNKSNINWEYTEKTINEFFILMELTIDNYKREIPLNKEFIITLNKYEEIFNSPNRKKINRQLKDKVILNEIKSIVGL